jgi:osmotically-inducible protein OsmY
MADQRRYERDQFRDDDDRMRDPQEWTYGRGRSWPGPRDDRDWAERTHYGQGRGRFYDEGVGGRGNTLGDIGFGGNDRSPGYAGERGASYGSDAYGPSERRQWRDESGRRDPRYASGHDIYWQGERDMWDRATDEISSWFGNDDAERRREMDKYRGRGPKNYARSEDRIREDVCDRLTDDGMVDASSIEVSVSGTEVTLGGTVPSRQQRRRAEICAERVSGVSHVQNNMRVKEEDGGRFRTAGDT